MEKKVRKIEKKTTKACRHSQRALRKLNREKFNRFFSIDFCPATYIDWHIVRLLRCANRS